MMYSIIPNSIIFGDGIVYPQKRGADGGVGRKRTAHNFDRPFGLYKVLIRGNP